MLGCSRRGFYFWQIKSYGNFRHDHFGKSVHFLIFGLSLSPSEREREGKDSSAAQSQSPSPSRACTSCVVRRGMPNTRLRRVVEPLATFEPKPHIKITINFFFSQFSINCFGNYFQLQQKITVSVLIVSGINIEIWTFRFPGDQIITLISFSFRA